MSAGKESGDGMSKDRLCKLCEGCAADLCAAGFTVVELPMLPQIAACEMCKAQRRKGFRAVRVYAVGKLKVDNAVENLVKSSDGDSAATLPALEMSLNLY